MSRYISLVFVIFLIAGCSLKEPSSKIGKKSFENEDYLILLALEYQQNGDIKNAIKVYNTLYEKSHKINYLIESAKISFLSKDMKRTEKLLKEALKQEPENEELKRIEIGFLTRQGNLKEAEKKILELLKKNKSTTYLKIAGSIYFQMKSYDLALKYFESAYKQEQDSSSLLNIVEILYNYLDKKDDAIALLETHIRMQSCDEKTCFKLIEIYGKEKNIDGIISTYKKLYKRYKDDDFAKKIVELYMYKKDRDGAINFLKQSGYNQEMLLDIYVSLKDFKNAYKIARKLYKDTNKIDYLGKMAIYEYETYKDGINKKRLNSISDKFEKVISKLYEPLYLNYYGYLLIDHDLNAKKGIKLVKEALLKEPDSPFYLDSLAWGYYKIGKCKEAKKIMDELVKGSKEEEIIMHWKKINECSKGKNK